MSINSARHFDKVILDSYEETPCSPTFEEFSGNVQGIRINAPDRVKVRFGAGEISPNSRIPFCVAMQFQSCFFAKLGDVYSHITVVMVDRRNGQSYSASLTPPDPTSEDVRNPNISPEILAASTEQMFINVNLVNYLPLPAVKTVYDLYATLAGEKSNSLVIEIR
ncbi:MAG: hypothetical protein V1809_03260 [Planctomycetota bacterium]